MLEALEADNDLQHRQFQLMKIQERYLAKHGQQVTRPCISYRLNHEFVCRRNANLDFLCSVEESGRQRFCWHCSLSAAAPFLVHHSVSAAVVHGY